MELSTLTHISSFIIMFLWGVFLYVSARREKIRDERLTQHEKVHNEIIDKQKMYDDALLNSLSRVEFNNAMESFRSQSSKNLHQVTTRLDALIMSFIDKHDNKTDNA